MFTVALSPRAGRGAILSRCRCCQSGGITPQARLHPLLSRVPVDRRRPPVRVDNPSRLAGVAAALCLAAKERRPFHGSGAPCFNPSLKLCICRVIYVEEQHTTRYKTLSKSQAIALKKRCYPDVCLSSENVHSICE